MKDHHPNFFLVGVVKGGTTSLHYYLAQHAQIYMSPIKETNYFSRDDIDKSLFSRDYVHDVNIDLDRFFTSGMQHTIHIAHIESKEDYLRLFSNVREEVAIGEASNSYILYPGAAQKIHDTYADARILMMLRDPAERAYSQYIMNLRLGKTLTRDFIGEITEDDACARKGWGANHQYLAIGKYYEQVHRYLEFFSKDQVMVCFYEDYRADVMPVLKSIYGFLQVDENFLPDTSEKLNVAGVARFRKLNHWINQVGLISWAKRRLPRSWRSPFKRWMYSTNQSDIRDMTAEEREFLVNYYREDVQKLSKLLDRDLSHWLE